VTPYITITDPTSPYSFGESGPAKEVKFTTNAKWKFATDATYDDVIASVETEGASASANTPYDLGATALSPENGSATFTPVTGAGTLAAGTKSTKITFNTDPVGSPTDITFSRIVPANWTFKSSDPAPPTKIPASGGDVTLTANTNLAWWGRQGTDPVKNVYSGIPAGTAPTAYKADDQVKVTVPARSETVDASWQTTPSVAIQAGYDAQSDVPAISTPKSISFTQDKYMISVTDVPSSITFYDTEVTITVTTDAQEYSLVFNDASNNDVIANVTGTSGPKTITVGANSSSAERIINIMNKYGGEVLASFTQQGELDYYYVYLYLNGPRGFTYEPIPGYGYYGGGFCPILRFLDGIVLKNATGINVTWWQISMDRLLMNTTTDENGQIFSSGEIGWNSGGTLWCYVCFKKQ
jgi:hypothetical protein